MNQQNKQFQCYLVDGDYISLVDQDQSLKKIDIQSREQFYNYLKSEILNNKESLNEMLLDIYDNWNKNYVVELKREQIFTLIILMFLNVIKRESYFGGFYKTNMEQIKKYNDGLCRQKGLCIENYIKQFYQNKDKFFQFSSESQEKIQFKNQVVKFMKNTIDDQEYKNKFSQFTPDDMKCQEIIQFNITNQKNEDQKNSTVVDFADQNIGGLTLDGHNCAQEEILMLIFPEAIISMIFIPPMNPKEAVLIKNLKKYSNYSGYESQFKWHQQNDLSQFYNMLAIDAKPFNGNQQQFKIENLEREMLKCYSGFQIALKESPNNDISTGRWGCGIFRGNQFLKTIIQLICFAQAKYDTQQNGSAKLIINSVNNSDLYSFVSKLQKINEKLNLKNLTILIQQLQQFSYQNDYQLEKWILQQLKEQEKEIQIQKTINNNNKEQNKQVIDQQISKIEDDNYQMIQEVQKQQINQHQIVQENNEQQIDYDK